ncbi:MAG: aspartate kinase [Candidatus Bathyarchaeia archaeon]
MKLVMKFGGSSLANGESFRNAVGIAVKAFLRGDVIVAVVSAVSDVTDQLIALSKVAENGKSNEVKKIVSALAERHERIAEVAVTDKNVLKDVNEQLKTLFGNLLNVLLDVSNLKELTPRAHDFILSFGERFAAAIFCGALRSLGIEARWFTGQEAGIVTDSNFGSARPLMKMTTYQVKEVLSPLLTQRVFPVVTGYIGATPEGITTTLGRGGSDYSATILATALGADEVWIWTDVDGLMTADPKIEPLAQTIYKISYEEAVEMAYFGAKGMHPKALEPVEEAGIPVRILNSYNPNAPGTLITHETSVRDHYVVKAIAMIPDVSLINVSGAGMVGTPGMAASIFDILGRKGVNLLMISQSSSEANISFVVPRNDLLVAVNALEMALLGRGAVRKITSENDVCIIAVVGAGMKGSPGVAARVFRAVADQGINIRMIAQGSSELNISFLVKAKDGVRAVRALHQEFKLSNR